MRGSSWVVVVVTVLVVDVVRGEALDAHGDPLPTGAVARLGTVRLDHGSLIVRFAASDDGSTAVSIGFEGTMKLWDLSDGHRTCEIATETGTDTIARFSSDGSRLAAMDWRGIVCVWEAATGKVLGRAPGQREREAVSVGFGLSPDGRRVALTDRKDPLQVFDVDTGLLAWRLAGKAGDVELPTYSPDGRWIACVRPQWRIAVLDAGSGRTIVEAESALHGVSDLFFTTRGLSLVTIASGEGVEIRDSQSLKLIRAVPMSDPYIRVSADGLRILRLSNGGLLAVHDLASQEDVASSCVPAPQGGTRRQRS